MERTPVRKDKPDSMTMSDAKLASPCYSHALVVAISGELRSDRILHSRQSFCRISKESGRVHGYETLRSNDPMTDLIGGSNSSS